LDQSGSTGLRLQGAAYQETLKSCTATGANIEGRAARDSAARAAVAFLRKAFGR